MEISFMNMSHTFSKVNASSLFGCVRKAFICVDIINSIFYIIVTIFQINVKMDMNVLNINHHYFSPNTVKEYRVTTQPFIPACHFLSKLMPLANYKMIPNFELHFLGRIINSSTYIVDEIRKEMTVSQCNTSSTLQSKLVFSGSPIYIFFYICNVYIPNLMS